MTHMKKIVGLLFITSLIVLISSCDDSNEDNTKEPKIITLDAIQGENSTVTASGQITGLKEIAVDFQCGIEYSTTPSFSADSSGFVIATYNYSENVYSVTLPQLISGQTYYYRAICINHSLAWYGETKQFSFLWENNYEDLLIGTWHESTWDYVFHEDYTGSRTQSGRTQTFTWSLDGDELELIFTSYDGEQKIYLQIIIIEFNATGFKAYYREDDNKSIISFIRR